MIVADPVTARLALTQRRLGCPRPGCAGVLRPWGRARPRWVYTTAAGGRVRLVPDRGRCTVCDRSRVLIPCWCLPRSGYTVQVVGQVLTGIAAGGPVRAVAAGAGVSVRTAYRWAHQVRRAASRLVAGAVSVAQACGDTTPLWLPPRPRPRPTP